MNQPNIQKNQPRPADIAVESSHKRFFSQLKLISKLRIKLWQGLLATVFITGFALAAVWLAVSDKMERSSAAGEISNMATVEYEDSDSIGYIGQSNTVVIPVAD